MLAQVPDPRRRRAKRYLLVFVLAAAVACTLAGAGNFREIGDHAADLPQGLPGRLGGRPHPLLRQIIAPSEKRIRTLLQQIDHVAIDYGHGRVIKRSLWVTDASALDFPHARRAVRIRRDGYDAAGALFQGDRACRHQPGRRPW